MKEIDFTKYTIKELEEIKIELDQAIKQRRKDVRDQLRKQMENMAEQEGITVDEVFGFKKEKKPRAKPKYQNPNNKKQTWSGLGKKPAWVEECIASGQALESLEIK